MGGLVSFARYHRYLSILTLTIAIVMVLLFAVKTLMVRLFPVKTHDPDLVQLDPGEPGVKNEVSALTGRWRLLNSDQLQGNGYNVPYHYIGISNSDVIWYRLSCDSGILRLDPTTHPKKLDWISTSTHSVQKGIYRVEGDRRQIAFSADPTRSQRPTAFESDAGRYVCYDLERGKDESVEYYEVKLLDKSYRWDGPQSGDIVIPSLNAARALAYIGDPAVPALFRALENDSIDRGSIVLALDEIGLPANLYEADIKRRDATSLRKWWAENRERTAVERSEQRVHMGLPPITCGRGE
jgi:uncharacterized protein (TIGR03067 family)